MTDLRHFKSWVPLNRFPEKGTRQLHGPDPLEVDHAPSGTAGSVALACLRLARSSLQLKALDAQSIHRRAVEAVIWRTFEPYNGGYRWFVPASLMPCGQ